MQLNNFSKSRAILLIGIFNLLFLRIAFSQGNTYSLNSDNTAINWKVKPEADVGGDASIHNLGYNTVDWVSAIVPGTVFGSFVEEGLEADPNFGDNIYNVDKSKYDRNFWYRTEFSVPSDYNGSTVWLNLEGVNRDADVYVNGTLLGSLHGFMERGRFNITSIINTNGNNSLVLLVYVPVPPMNISAMPSYVSSASWDWMPYVPGLNMGITDDVYLSKSGPVTIIDPWIRTAVPTTSSANLTISTELANSSSVPISGTLNGTINPGNIQFSQNVTIGGGENATVVKQLTVSNPKLWWPNGYGDPNLYVCDLEFVASEISDSKAVTFGIREYSYDIEGDVLHFKINGKRIFVKGGNWGMSEYMLRCRGKEYDTKVRLHKEMNFNMIRNWVGSTTDEEFYDACDKYGIMVWDDFWMITTYFNFPRSKEIFEKNVIEKIKRYRNHPSIALWCGANEFTPPADWDIIYTSAIEQYDGNDRRYQPNSREGSLSGSGPWLNLNPSSYYDSPPRIGGPNSWGMRSELGTAVFTTFESFKEFIPEENWWPRNDMWDKHFFGDTYAPAAGADNYMTSVNTRYGISSGIEQFCKKAQLLNIETNKAMFEGWIHNMWDDASGLLIWMSQSAYPSLVWQTYDYYYDLTGAYWGAKKGSEPVHILMDPNTGDIEIANTSGEDYSNLTADIAVYNMDGTATAINTTVTADELLQNSLVKIHTIDFSAAKLSNVHFIKLKLKNSSGDVLSENFYWRGTTESDFTALNTMPTVQPEVTRNISVEGENTIIEATVTNPVSSPAVAFATRVQVVKSGSGERVLPVFISDSYFSLLPGESKVVRMEFETDLLEGESAELLVEPYNSGNNEPVSPNLALHQPVTVSSSVGSNSGALAVDGDASSTRWESDYSDPQWLYVDLGKTYAIDSIILTWEGAYGKNYELQVSDNAMDWSTIKTVTDNSALVNRHKNLSASGRYVRVYGTERGTMWGYAIYELEVYGVFGKAESQGITDLGGTISAQYDDSPQEEGVKNLIDNDLETKFLTFHNSSWVMFHADAHYVVKSYEIVSANDNPQRDPFNWTLEGSNDGLDWVTLDTRSEEDFLDRFQTRKFSFNNTQSFAYFRLLLNTNGEEILQFSELELFGYEAEILGFSSQSKAAAKLTLYPVPSEDVVYVSVNMKNAGRASVSVYNFSGKEVRRFTKALSAGDHLLEWNSQDQKGNYVSPGVYFMKVNTKQGTEIYKVIKQ